MPDNTYIVIGANGDSIFRRLMTAMSREDLANDARLAQNDGRSRHVHEIDAANFGLDKTPRFARRDSHAGTGGGTRRADLFGGRNGAGRPLSRARRL